MTVIKSREAEAQVSGSSAGRANTFLFLPDELMDSLILQIVYVNLLSAQDHFFLGSKRGSVAVHGAHINPLSAKGGSFVYFYHTN